MATAADIIQYLEKFPPEQDVTMRVWVAKDQSDTEGEFQQVPIRSYHSEEYVPWDDVTGSGPPQLTSVSLSSSYY